MPLLSTQRPYSIFITMTQAEVKALPDDKLLEAWEEIKTIFRMGAQEHFGKQQGLIFFVDFVNVSSEISKRGLDDNK